MGAGHREDQAMVRTLEFSALPPYPPAQGEGLERELIIDPTDLSHRVSESFQAGEHVHTGRVPHPKSRSSSTWEAPQTSHMCLFI